MSEALTPEEETIEPADESDRSEGSGTAEDEGAYEGPDPEDDPKGDGSDEDQGT